MENLILYDFSNRSLKDAIGAVEVLALRIIFKIYWGSSFKYLAVKDEIGSVAEVLGLKAKPEAKGFFNSLILLLIQETTSEVGVTKAQSWQK